MAELSAHDVFAKNVCIATDDKRIAEVVQSAGLQAFMTAAAVTGTGR